MNRTQIEWVKNPDGTQGYTWNPITGCLNGCEYCYARKLANGRLRSRYLANSILPSHDEPDHEAHHSDPFYPRFWTERLKELNQGYKRNKGVFVCDMSDLFGIGVPEDWTRQVLDAIKRTWMNPYCRFYLLTKQPQNLIKFSPFPENCWVGVTATGYKAFNKALDYLKEIEAGGKYLSLEPLLERIQFYPERLHYCGIDQVIIGAQTRPKKPPYIEWVREIIETSDKAGIAMFLKNNLGWPRLTHEGSRPFYTKHHTGTWELRQEMPK